MEYKRLLFMGSFVEHRPSRIKTKGAVYLDEQQIRCPSCSSLSLRRTSRHGWGDALRRMIGEFPWRCGKCRSRFYLRNRALPLKLDI